MKREMMIDKLNRIIRIFFILFLSIGLTLHFEPTQVQAANQTGVVTASALNVRQNAGTNYKVIGSLRRGNKVTVIATKGQWYQIKYNNKTGFVYKAYLKVDSEKPVAKPAPKPAVKPTPKPAPKPAPQPAPKPAPQPAPKPAPQPAPKPAPQPAPKPAPQPAPKPASQPALKPATPVTIGANKIGIAGIYKSYVTELNPNNVQATIDKGNICGNVTKFNASDSQTTYFTGHNPGVFDYMATNMAIGKIVTITDANGTAFNYKVVDMVTTDKSANRGNAVMKSVNKNLNQLFSYGSGQESIIIQYCTGANSMVVWYAVKA